MSPRTDYDVWHSVHHRFDPCYDDTSIPWYQRVAKSIGNVEGLRTREVACGRGGLVRKLGRSASLYCGLDFSLVAISFAEQRRLAEDSGTPAYFIQGDAQALPFPDDFLCLL
jgi:ubiquinone/menaquinone biosynthesis C-methylase UbiE